MGIERAESPVIKPGRSRRSRRAWAIIATFAFAAMTVDAAVALIHEELPPELRDPEYGLRIASLKARVAEHPDRPLVLVVGSSRTVMGFKPAEWETIRPHRVEAADPLFFNLSSIGGGPLLEMVLLRRVYDAGIQPSAILLEYWPPLLSPETGTNAQLAADDRLSLRECALADESSEASASLASEWLHRLNPIYSMRHRLLAQLSPKWLPIHDSTMWMWKEIDGWGWKSGCNFKPGSSAARSILTRQAHEVFTNRFAAFRIGAREDRALRNSISFAQIKGAAVRLFFMPESNEFRSWYPQHVERIAHDYLERLTREMSVHVIDARNWMDDGYFSDGFHLTQFGAVEFSRRAVGAIAESLKSE